jgi:hypothetical protein
MAHEDAIEALWRAQRNSEIARELQRREYEQQVREICRQREADKLRNTTWLQTRRPDVRLYPPDARPVPVLLDDVLSYLQVPKITFKNLLCAKLAGDTLYELNREPVKRQIFEFAVGPNGTPEKVASLFLTFYQSAKGRAGKFWTDIFLAACQSAGFSDILHLRTVGEDFKIAGLIFELKRTRRERDAETAPGVGFVCADPDPPSFEHIDILRKRGVDRFYYFKSTIAKAEQSVRPLLRSIEEDFERDLRESL